MQPFPSCACKGQRNVSRSPYAVGARRGCLVHMYKEATMPFPVDDRGEVWWRPKELHRAHLQHEVLHALSIALGEGRGTASVQDTTVSFTGGLFRFVGNVNILVPITHENLEVTLVDDTVVVAYYLSFRNYLVLTSGFALFVFSLVGNAVELLSVRLVFPALIWM